MCVFHLQDSEGNFAPAQNTCILKELETKLNDAVMGATNVIKSKNNLAKKCLFRRGAALYTAMKRIKGNKKQRQITTRRTLKKQCVNDVENDAIICAISSEEGVKPFLKTIDRQRPNRSNAGPYVGRTLEPPRLSAYTYTSKKCTATKVHTSCEETAVVRHGAKRMKIVSLNASKAFPEIGESSCAVEKANESSRIPHACNKHNIKRTCNRQHCRLPTEQMKSGESSELKEVNKKSTKGNSILEGGM